MSLLKIASDVLKALARDLLRLMIAAGLGVGIGAAVCWYYGLPLIFSLVGGLIVLGVIVALWLDF